MSFEICTTENTVLMQLLITTRDKERDELGALLQDEVSQLLASARLLIEQARETTDDTTDPLRKGLHYLTMAMTEIRRVSQAFNSGIVKDIGLEAAIGAWMEEGCGSGRRDLDFSLEFEDGLEEKLSPDLKLMVYKIIQEQTTNIYRHADAGCVSIELQQMGDSLYFSISDDGKGFNSMQPQKGIGFVTMQTRVAAFHGSFTLQSSPGTGCHIEIEVPLYVAALLK